jgi:hypothetical protein
MKNFYSRTGLLILAMGVSLSGWAANPCMPIAMDCMKNGFYKGGAKVGKGLVKDCVLPVSSGTLTLPNTSYTQDVLSACNADIMQKMKNKPAAH